MCGIVAATGHGSEAFVQTTVRAMHHRGPDAHGVVATGDTALGMSRLAVMDPNARADQPMRRGDHTVVYNGEVYNFRELRGELVALGVAFETDGDTEVVLQSIRAWGISEACRRFEGMFAFVVFEHSNATITFARDRFGIKPLYWRNRESGGVAICSEARHLSDDRRNAADIVALAEFLQFGSPITRCAIRDVIELPAGSIVSIADGSLRHSRFAVAGELGVTADVSAADALRGSLAKHLVADRNIALWLSGGFDSAILLAAARDVGATTIAMTLATGTNHDEVRRAVATARHFEVEHRIIEVTPEVVAAAVPQFTAAMDQPTIDGFNTFLMSRASQAADCAVAISGLGGDEVLGGYGYYRPRPAFDAASVVLRALPRAARKRLVRVIAQRQRMSSARLGAMIEATSLATRHAGSRTLFDHAEVQALVGISAELPTTSESVSERVTLAQLDFDRYLRPTLLRDSDVFSMACGVELRVPMLDAAFVGAVLHAAQPPSKQSLANAWQDDCLRDLAIAKKLTFSMPWDQWLDAVIPDNAALLARDDPWGPQVDASQARVLLERSRSTPFENRLRAWALVVLAQWNLQPLVHSGSVLPSALPPTLESRAA